MNKLVWTAFLLFLSMSAYRLFGTNTAFFLMPAAAYLLLVMTGYFVKMRRQENRRP